MSYEAHKALALRDEHYAIYKRQYEARAQEAMLYKGFATGLSHHCYDTYRGTMDHRPELDVRPDPTNKYDENAVGLFYNNRQIGWIPKAENFYAAQALRDGCVLKCKVLKHSPENDLSARLNIIVYVSTFPTLTNSKKQLTKETTAMANIKSTLDKNIDLSKSAAFLEAGRIANNQISKIAGQKLPIMVRAYADTAMGRLLLANIALMARDHFRPNDEKLGKLVNAMTVSAYQEVLQHFDIEQMIDDLVSNSTIKKALKSLDTAEA